MALSDKDAESLLYVKNNNFDAATLVNTNKLTKSDQYLVKTSTLEQIIKDYKINRVDLLKLDIEGSEYKVIKKGVKLIKSIVQRLIVEYHYTITSGSRKKIIDLMTANNFELTFEHRHVLGFVNRA